MKPRRPAPGATAFRLYVASGSPASHRAISNLRAFCAKHLTTDANIEIVDVLKEPHRAASDGVLVTPTLMRVHPAPKRTVIGDLRDELTLTAVLDGAEAAQ